MTPALSVVVPSVNGWADLGPVLTALRADSTGSSDGPPVATEVLVVDRVGAAVRDRVRSVFPDVTVIDVPPGTTIPAMRARAIAYWGRRSSP